MPHQNFLLLVLADEASRHDSQSAVLRAQRAHLDPAMQFEAWDSTAKVTYDHALLSQLVSLRFLEARPTSPSSAMSASVRPVGKSFENRQRMA